MSVYVDALREWGWRLGPSAHLYADTLAELHSFAARLGLRRTWFQDKPDFPHYDLTAAKRGWAVSKGAREVSRDELVAWVRRRRRPAR